MSRNARLVSLSGYYHVMQRGIGRQIIFNTDEDRSSYLRTLAYYKEKYRVDLIAYCVMDNHVHLIVHSNDIKSLSGMMSCIGNCYAQYYNVNYSHVGHVFQNRFKSQIIESLSSLTRCIMYVHYNPEAAGICNQQSYNWSSLNHYLHDSDYTKLTDTKIFLDLIGGKNVFEEQSFNYAANANISEDAKLFEIDSASRVSIDVARSMIHDNLGYENGMVIKTLDKESRRDAIEFLLKQGVSFRNIERLTGVSRGISQEISRQLHSE